jgi:O-antigen/teichoic acid export membrane protein
VMGTDNIVISVFLGVDKVAAYAVAFQLWALAIAALWSGVDVLLPFFARWAARDAAESLRLAFIRSTKFAVAGTILAAILLAAYGRRAIAWWVGPTLYAGDGVLWVFALMLLIATPIHTAALVLAGLGRHRAPAIGGAVEALLNLALSVLLVRRLGVLGVALGTLVAGLLTNAWVAPRAACRELKISARTYLAVAVAPGLAPAAVTIGVTVLLIGPTAGSLPGTALAVLLSVAVYAVVFWVSGVRQTEKQAILALFAR